MTITETISAAGAAPCCWNRHAIHPSSGSTKNSKVLFAAHRDEARGDQRGEERGGFEDALPSHAAAAASTHSADTDGGQSGRSDPEEGRDDEHAHRVTRPPHRPGLEEVVGVDAVGEEQRERADRRADHHGRQRTEEDDRERVPHPSEPGVEPGALQERDAGDRREGVAGRRSARTRRHPD